MGLNHHGPFDIDDWQKKYYQQMNDLLQLFDKNPYLTIKEVYETMRLLQYAVNRLHDHYQIKLKAARINDEIHKNPPKQ